MIIYRVIAPRAVIVDRQGRAVTIWRSDEFTTDAEDATMHGKAHIPATAREVRRHLDAGRLVEVASCS
jgi:hypothetical protein